MSVQADREPLSIDVVSDVVCPWCFIGKRRLDKARALRPDVPVAVNWRPFQLDATIPPGGIERRVYLERKFGSAERIAGIYARVAEAGAEEGIAFRFDRIERSPNTLDAHRLIRWAQGAGAQEAVVDRLFDFYFLDGRDIGDPVVLAAAAEQAGMDGGQVADQLSGDADRQAVVDDISAAARLGISGVPYFIFAGRFGVSGAQPAEALAEAIDKALVA